MMRASLLRFSSATALLLAARLAGAQAAPAPTPRPAPPPAATAATAWQPSHPTQNNQCLGCHAEQREAANVGVHSEHGVRCIDCHGGNPLERALPAAHNGMTGKLSKPAIAQLCGSCHSDPNKMREYGLATGQLAEYRTSKHGQLLFEKHNDDAPTCTDCHGTHIIYPPYDARSQVYAPNIPKTCAHCHNDDKLMAKYNLHTNQYDQYRTSAHGVSLYEKQNFAAPTCIACHGAHSALPPTRTEVSSVCGSCHQLVAQAFNTGPHAAAVTAGKLKGCLGCHGNHDTRRLADDSISAQCDQCHANDSRLHQMGVDLQRRMTQATTDLRNAQEAVERLRATGQRTADAQFRYQAMLTNYLQIAQVQHSLDADKLETLEGRVSAGSIELEQMAGSAEDTRWEHKLILIPVWFLSLSAVVLALLGLRALRRTDEG